MRCRLPRYREVRLVLTKACQARCRYCGERSSQDEAEIAPADIKRVLNNTDPNDQLLILTGGEPTMHPQFPQIVEELRQDSRRRVALETNGFVFRNRLLVKAISDVSWEAVRVHAPASSRLLFEQISGLPGSFDAWTAALSNLAQADIPLELAVLVSPETVDSLPGFFESRLPIEGIRCLRLSLPDPRRMAPGTTVGNYDEDGFLTALATFLDAARKLDKPVFFDRLWYIPPCRQGSLLALGLIGSPLPILRANDPPDGFRKEAVCLSCRLSDICPGTLENPPGGAFANPGKLLDEAETWRYRGLLRAYRLAETPKEQKHAFTLSFLKSSAIDSAVLRVNLRCNMACPFCSVALDGTEPTFLELREAIEELAARGIRRLVLSGGEPLLNQRLDELINLAKRCGIGEIELQTNGLMLRTVEAARKLEAAGLDRVLVSLHGSTAEVADRCTACPGGFRHTLWALESLAATSLAVRINFVVNGLNYTELPRFVEWFFHDLRYRHPHLELMLSVARPIQAFRNKKLNAFVSFTQLAPFLVQTLDQCRQLGVERISGLLGECGIPPCVLGRDFERLRGMFEDDILVSEQSNNVYLETCSGCPWKTRCVGLPEDYLSLFGTEEFRQKTENR
jgi:MoaA/NifB/PqqE/SkfB family radical SAM enzyme